VSGYDSKTRYSEAKRDLISASHCLYGLDADLVMLSLATHEPYFSILREKVFEELLEADCQVLFRPRQVAGQHRKEISFQRTDDFQYLSISLLREYLGSLIHI
jgi:5'-3' exoribonuclease 2